MSTQTSKKSKPVRPQVRKKKEVWKEVCKIPKRFLSGKDPINKFHVYISEHLPKLKTISDVGVSKTTNDYFRTQLQKLADKEVKLGYWSKSHTEFVVEMSMLNYSPCTLDDVAGIEDFVLYRRK